MNGEAHSADYQSFVGRGGSPAFDRYLTRWCERVADSEEWALYQRREARR